MFQNEKSAMIQKVLEGSRFAYNNKKGAEKVSANAKAKSALVMMHIFYMIICDKKNYSILSIDLQSNLFNE